MFGLMRKTNRFFDPATGRAMILALDHGVSEGMTEGLDQLPALLEKTQEMNVQGVLLNKGLARYMAGALHERLQLGIQLSAGTRHGLPPYNKSIVCTVPEALRLGADAVCMHINIGNDMEDRMLSDMGLVTDEAHQVGVPVLAIIYARGGHIVNEFDPSLIAHCIRLGGELGVDMVCTPYSGDQEGFARAVAGCPAPVLLGGGPTQPDFTSFIKMLKEGLEAGASGVVVGRNIFQQDKPEDALQKIVKVTHTVKDAK